MNKVAFGDRVDIHGGGRDLIFPHHENEIAQSEALTGKRFVKYWIHNGLIKVNGQKMSKSLGNSLLLEDLLDKYSAESIKFALLSTSYRNDINITDDLFPSAEAHMTEFYRVIDEVEKSGLAAEDFDSGVEKAFDSAMEDDFNTSLALSHVYGFMKQAKTYLSEKSGKAVTVINDLRRVYSLLGLFKANAAEYLKKYGVKEQIPEEILALAEKMQQARLVKDYSTADAIRTEIADRGYTVKNTKDGYSVDKK